jgi:hypothetical protein
MNSLHLEQIGKIREKARFPFNISVDRSGLKKPPLNFLRCSQLALKSHKKFAWFSSVFFRDLPPSPILPTLPSR